MRVSLALLTAVLLAAAAPARAAEPAVPPFTHVVEVMLENESATKTFEDATAAPALQKLRAQGVYVPQFFAAGHASLSNYMALFGGVQPNAQGQSDCLGQPYQSCIFPASVPTLGALLDRRGLAWKIYSEGMLGAPGGHTCLHAPVRSLPDPYQGPLTNGYATRHNPAPWFASVLDKDGSEAYCQAHSVDLTELWKDAASPATLPAWSFVEPDTCHDGHDTASSGGCALDPEGPGAPSGVAAIDAWLPGFVERLTHAPAWDAGSLLVITFDEGDGADTAGCGPCHDTSAGGRIGALLIGRPVAHPGSVATWSGDHYSLLRTWETAWGMPTLKSLAADATAAALVHDGDPGVTPLTGVWRTASPPTRCTTRALRIRLARGARRAIAYAGRTRVAATLSGGILTIAHPPARSFALRVVITGSRGRRTTLRRRVRFTAATCTLTTTA